MSLHLLLEASAPKRLPKCLAPIAALILAAAVAGFVSALPRTRSLSWADLISSATARVFAVFIAASVVIWTSYSIVDREQRASAGFVAVQVSAAALWLAPLVLFLRESSPWAIPISAILACAAAQLFDQPQKFLAESISQRPPLSLNGYVLSAPLGLPEFRSSFFAAAALIAQVGVVAAFAGDMFTAALLVGFSCAFWAWWFPRKSNAQISRAQQLKRLLSVMALSIVLTAGGLIGYLRKVPRLHGYGVASLIRRIHPAPRERTAQELGRSPGSTAHASEGMIAGRAEGNSGIILWPEKLVRTKLVAPSPILGNGGLNVSPNSKPLVIPFDGVYWFFKAPDTQPPRSSRQAHGSPDVLNIRSTDFRPLSMEAHQSLGNAVDLHCCGKIQIMIRNADRYPGTVSLGLILIDTSAPGKPSQSLGRVAVESSEPWRIYETQRLTRETLNFMIPANPGIRRFDEFKVLFRLDDARADYGAKVAIDHFVLVPRGI